MYPAYLRPFILILCLCSCHLYAQDAGPQPGFGIEANAIAGMILRHKFSAPIPPVSTEFDVNFVWRTYGKKAWHQQCHFPVIGIGATYTNYGNNAIFGQCVGIYPNLQIPIYRNEKLEWTFRFGDGLGYVTRKYQTTAPVDTQNTIIGSHLNDFAMVMMDVRLYVNKHWNLQAGANFSHISNGDYHQPNLGVNMYGLHFGVQYFPVTSRPKLIVKELPKPKNTWVADIREGISYKEARAVGNPIVPSYITTVYVGRHWKGKNKYYFGADYAFHNDVLAFVQRYQINQGHPRSSSWDGAFIAGNEFLIGRLGLVTQFGIYYHQTYLKFDAAYEKFGGNYYIIRKDHGPLREVFLSAMLLTHGIVAQYSEFGVGVGFW